jgi:hypothetical protein
MGWLSRLIFGARVRDDGRVSEADIQRAIEMAVERTDPRLRMVSGYRRKLRKPAIRSLLYLNRVVKRIPGPVEVSRKAYGADPQVNALFASVDSLRDVFSLSEPLRAYLDANPGRTDCYCTLAMFRHEKGVFGMELMKGILRKGVSQTAVNFSGHRIGVAGNSLEQVKQASKWRGMESLCISALERISALRAQTRELREQQVLLQARLRQLKAKGDGLEPVSDQEAAAADDPEEIRRHLEENARQLQETRASLETLDGYLTQVAKVLSHPSHYLNVKPYSVSVTRMGIKAPEDSGRGASKVVTAHIKRPRQPSFDLILVHFPRAELRDEEYYRKRSSSIVHTLSLGR